MRSLTIVLATRKRPHLLVPTIRRTLKNVRSPNTRMVVMVDDDDEDTVLVRPQIEKMGAVMCVRPRPKSFGEKFNIGTQEIPADVYMMHVDYAPYITEGFDQKILDAASIYPDGYAVIYNWWANPAFPSLNAVTHNLAEKMGGMYPGYFPYWWIDHHLDDVARMIDRVVFADVKADCSERKERPDKPWTTDKRETWFWALLFDAMALERRELAKSIIESSDFDETPARKRALINNFPWIAHHSLIVNSAARSQTGADIPYDDWYRDVKAAGVKKLKSLLTAEQWKEVEIVQDNIGKKAA